MKIMKKKSIFIFAILKIYDIQRIKVDDDFMKMVDFFDVLRTKMTQIWIV